MSDNPDHHATDGPPRGSDEVDAANPWQAYAELGRIPLSELPLSEVLRQVARLAQEALPGVDEVSVTIVEDGKPASVAFTGALASSLDERQYDDGFGPCLDAAKTGESVLLEDLEVAADRYPDFVSVARRAGVTSLASIGMPVPQRVVGGINLYSTSSRGISREDVQVGQVFASYAAVALANASMLTSTKRLANQMREAMESRATIEHAIGVLIALRGFTPDEAFQHLSVQSQRTNRKVRDLAAEIVQTASQRAAP